MTNRSQQKGTAFESLVLPGFQAHYPSAMRLGKQGANDRGDIWIPDVDYVVECKNEKGIHLGEWANEAATEAFNAGRAIGIVVHKRKGKTLWTDQWVTLRLEDFLDLVEP